MAGGEPVRLVDRHSARAAISPDGKLLACSYRDGPADSLNRMAVIPFEAGRLIRVFDMLFFGGPIRWTADGSALTYTDRARTNIWILPLAEGPRQQITEEGWI